MYEIFENYIKDQPQNLINARESLVKAKIDEDFMNNISKGEKFLKVVK